MPNFEKARYVVIFRSMHEVADPEYDQVAERMVELGSAMPGFCGLASIRDASGEGITLSYWEDLESITVWKAQAEHRIAQAHGRSRWYEWFELQVCEILRHKEFKRK